MRYNSLGSIPTYFCKSTFSPIKLDSSFHSKNREAVKSLNFNPPIMHANHRFLFFKRAICTCGNRLIRLEFTSCWKIGFLNCWLLCCLHWSLQSHIPNVTKETLNCVRINALIIKSVKMLMLVYLLKICIVSLLAFIDETQNLMQFTLIGKTPCTPQSWWRSNTVAVCFHFMSLGKGESKLDRLESKWVSIAGVTYRTWLLMFIAKSRTLWARII